MQFIQLAGHLGADPETRVTPSGVKVTSMRLAVNVFQNGKDETIWWRITIWGNEFDKMLTHLKKGSGIIVAGEMSKPEIYNDKAGQPQISLNMTARMIRFNPFGKPSSQEQPQGQYSNSTAHGSPVAEETTHLIRLSKDNNLMRTSMPNKMKRHCHFSQ